MTRSTKSSASAAARPDVYQTVTDRIIEMLDAGTIPWQRPWALGRTAAGDPNGPRNIRGTLYRGINVWLLAAQGYDSPLWLTFNQAKEIGGNVRKGEKGTAVILWKPIPKKADPADPDAKPGQYLMLRQYTVFNVQQCDLPEGAYARLDAKYSPAPAPDAPVFDPIAAADDILAGMPDRPPIGHGGNRAYYRPDQDSVQMPAQTDFNSPAEYYSTLFHELAHSTGHARRLNRPSLTDATVFGDTNYSEEELIAEFAAAFIAGHAGILPAVVSNSAAYIASWRRSFKDNPRMVVDAARKAQKAADWILAATPATADSPEDAVAAPQEAALAAA